MGSMERWDGHRGFGPLNAKRAMERACALAKQNGVGVVALGNNNHWMRGGTYGWLAADHGCIGICWSNTDAQHARLGRQRLPHRQQPAHPRPCPRSDGEHVDGGLRGRASSATAKSRTAACAVCSCPFPAATTKRAS